MLITCTDPYSPQILYCNRSLERISGHDAAALVGATPAILHGPNTEKCALKRFAVSLTRQREAHMTVTQRRKNGEDFTAEVLAGYVGLNDAPDGVYVSLTRETGDGVPPLTFDDIIEC